MRLKLVMLLGLLLLVGGCGDDDGTSGPTDVDTTGGNDVVADTTQEDVQGDIQPDEGVDVVEDTLAPDTQEVVDDVQPDVEDVEDTELPPVGQTTLEEVKLRGSLNCGVSTGLLGFSVVEEDGSASGFDVDFCKAIATAVLGKGAEVNYIELTGVTRFTALKDGDIDVLVRNTTWTQGRDIAFDFGPTTYYDGQKLMASAASGFTSASMLADLDGHVVCVSAGTTSTANVQAVVAAVDPPISVTFHEVPDDAARDAAFLDGTCDVITTDESGLVGAKVVFETGSTPITDLVIFPPEPISKEPLGPVYRADDSNWGDIVNWTVYALMLAEEMGVTSSNIDDDSTWDAKTIALFGGEGELQTKMGLSADAFRAAIEEVGNYGEIYDRNLTNLGLNRTGSLNAMYTHGGLIYSPSSSGSIPTYDTMVDDEGGLLGIVQARGELNCGVSTGVIGFSVVDESGEAEGFDVDFCKAIAIAVLDDASAVNYVELTGATRFQALADGSIDVLVRNTTWTQGRDLVFDFAPTTYYDGQKLMARESDGFTSSSTIADLDGHTICVSAGTTSTTNIKAAVDAVEPAISVTFHEVADDAARDAAFLDGTCDVITTDESGLVGLKVTFATGETPLTDLAIFPPSPISKEPLGPVYRTGDPQWADVVNWTVYAMMLAEEYGISSANIDDDSDWDAKTIALFGGAGELQTAMGIDAEAFLHVIMEVGNYGEVYERNLTDLGLMREGSLNQIYTQGGLIYAPPADGSIP